MVSAKFKHTDFCGLTSSLTLFTHEIMSPGTNDFLEPPNEELTPLIDCNDKPSPLRVPGCGLTNAPITDRELCLVARDCATSQQDTPQKLLDWKTARNACNMVSTQIMQTLAEGGIQQEHMYSA